MINYSFAVVARNGIRLEAEKLTRADGSTCNYLRIVVKDVREGKYGDDVLFHLGDDKEFETFCNEHNIPIEQKNLGERGHAA